LEHSSDANSVMYARLQQGVARRGFTDHDLALLRQDHSDADSSHDVFEGLHAWDFSSFSSGDASAVPMLIPAIPTNINETQRALDDIMEEWMREQFSMNPGPILFARDSFNRTGAEVISREQRATTPKVGVVDITKAVADFDSFFESMGEGSLDSIGLSGKRTRKAR